jgi:hypothetical protein
MPPVENRSGLDGHAYDVDRVDPRLESPSAGDNPNRFFGIDVRSWDLNGPGKIGVDGKYLK